MQSSQQSSFKAATTSPKFPSDPPCRKGIAQNSVPAHEKNFQEIPQPDSICEKPPTNQIFDRERLMVLWPQMRHRCPHASVLLSVV